MMQAIGGFVVGVVVASVVWYLVARNNKKRVAEVLGKDPKVAWDNLIADLRKKLKDAL